MRYDTKKNVKQNEREKGREKMRTSEVQRKGKCMQGEEKIMWNEVPLH